jgi:hypothetical protein
MPDHFLQLDPYISSEDRRVGNLPLGHFRLVWTTEDG